jgi:hypothetical protein
MRDGVSGQVGRPLAPSVLGEIFQNAQKTLHSPRLQIILRQQHQTKLLGQNRQFPVGVFRRLARCFRIEISSLGQQFLRVGESVLVLNAGAFQQFGQTIKPLKDDGVRFVPNRGRPRRRAAC